MSSSTRELISWIPRWLGYVITAELHIIPEALNIASVDAGSASPRFRPRSSSHIYIYIVGERREMHHASWPHRKGIYSRVRSPYGLTALLLVHPGKPEVVTLLTVNLDRTSSCLFIHSRPRLRCKENAPWKGCYINLVLFIYNRIPVCI